MDTTQSTSSVPTPTMVMVESKSLSFIKDDVRAIRGVDQKPKWGTSVNYFFGQVGQTAKLTFQEEKDIIPFILLQWLTIVVGYYTWVQVLSWIPPEVWKSTENSSSGSVGDLVLLAWSFIMVGIVSLPLEVFSAGIVATHLLKRSGQRPTFVSSLQLILPNIWSQWVFGWTDAWITVRQILKRLPKKGGSGDSALSETLYYAWKLGTIGVLPALTTGRSIFEAGKESVLLVRNKLSDTALLRTGYSVLCWIIGIAAYIGSIFYLIAFSPPIPEGQVYSHVYDIYLLLGVPIVIAVGILLIFVRPIYLIASADIYADYLQENQKPLIVAKPGTVSKLISVLIVFSLLCIAVLLVFLFRNQLGISAMLAAPYH